MDLSCKSIYNNLDDIVKGNTIDISECTFIHPWVVIYICQLLIERHTFRDKGIILPEKNETLEYLKRIHFDKALKYLGYDKECKELETKVVNERENHNVQELLYCQFRDYFNARLDRFFRMFSNFGLEENQARLVVALVGELGNNVYDHNSGNWPTDIGGCFISGQNYPKNGCMEFVIGDPGIGFLGSLKTNYPYLEDDISAIKLGLSGKTGRVDEKRGNGLKFIQNWTLNKFSGSILIHSGSGQVYVDEKGTENKIAPKITGTIIQIMLNYTG